MRSAAISKERYRQSSTLWESCWHSSALGYRLPCMSWSRCCCSFPIVGLKEFSMTSDGWMGSRGRGSCLLERVGMEVHTTADACRDCYRSDATSHQAELLTRALRPKPLVVDECCDCHWCRADAGSDAWHRLGSRTIPA